MCGRVSPYTFSQGIGAGPAESGGAVKPGVCLHPLRGVWQRHRGRVGSHRDGPEAAKGESRHGGSRLCAAGQHLTVAAVKRCGSCIHKLRLLWPFHCCTTGTSCAGHQHAISLVSVICYRATTGEAMPILHWGTSSRRSKTFRRQRASTRGTPTCGASSPSASASSSACVSRSRWRYRWAFEYIG
jgi:hypothetical protein